MATGGLIIQKDTGLLKRKEAATSLFITAQFKAMDLRPSTRARALILKSPTDQKDRKPSTS
jgi:hypothetical protein